MLSHPQWPKRKKKKKIVRVLALRGFGLGWPGHPIGGGRTTPKLAKGVAPPFLSFLFFKFLIF
jgi:hypothetical protein